MAKFLKHVSSFFVFLVLLSPAACAGYGQPFGSGIQHSASPNNPIRGDIHHPSSVTHYSHANRVGVFGGVVASSHPYHGGGYGGYGHGGGSVFIPSPAYCPPSGYYGGYYRQKSTHEVEYRATRPRLGKSHRHHR